jgi:hypothetical protein
MDLESRVEELKQELELMRVCYYKGYGGEIQKIFVKCDMHVREPKNPYWKKTALNALERIENLYRKIPFEKLESNADFSSIFVTRDLLEKYGPIVRDFFSKNQEMVNDRITQLGTAIAEVGRIFQDKIDSRLKELRAIPGYEKYDVYIIDRKGHKLGI